MGSGVLWVEKTAVRQDGETGGPVSSLRELAFGEGREPSTTGTAYKRLRKELATAMIFQHLLPPYQLDLLRYAATTGMKMGEFVECYNLFWGWPDSRLRGVLTLCYTRGCDFLAYDDYVRDLTREGIEPNPGMVYGKKVKSLQSKKLMKIKLIRPPKSAVKDALVQEAINDAVDQKDGLNDALHELGAIECARPKEKRAPRPSADVRNLADKMSENVFCNVKHCEPKWYTHLLGPVVGGLVGLFSPTLGAVAGVSTALLARPLLRAATNLLSRYVVNKFKGNIARATLNQYVGNLNKPRDSTANASNTALALLMKFANFMAWLAGGNQILGIARPVDTAVVKNGVDIRHSSANSSKVDLEPVRIQRVEYLNFVTSTETTLYVEPYLASECCAHSCLTDKSTVETIRRKAYSNTQLNLPVVFRGAITSDTTVLAEVMKTTYAAAGLSVWDLNGVRGSEVIWLAMAIASVTFLTLLPPIRRTARSYCIRAAARLTAKSTCILLGQY